MKEKMKPSEAVKIFGSIGATIIAAAVFFFGDTKMGQNLIDKKKNKEIEE